MLSRKKIYITISICLMFFLCAGILIYSGTRSPINSPTSIPNSNEKSNQKNEQSITIAESAPNKTPTTETPEKNKPNSELPRSVILFSDKLDGANRIYTNEFTHWSKAPCPYTSTNWDMTSGTLLIKNNSGYSGVPTLENKSICESASANNSSIFRLNTKDYSFSNVTTSMDFMMVRHGGGNASINSYDGVHMWARYQSQYALYIVTISRWDGIVVIKKKIPSEVAHCEKPANDGCYYNLSKELKRPDLAIGGAWHHIDMITNDDALGVVHIELKIDGQQVLDVVDNNTNGPAYHKGAVGVRGDNTEFYFKNFIVTSN